jgi:OOP family OmpA-OmpF porin
MKKLILALSIFLLFFSIESHAQLYVGGGIGNSFINKTLTDLNGEDFKVDENSFGYKVFAGFGKKFLGAEGGYRDLGKVQTTYNSTNLQSKITGWDVAARGKLDIGPIFAFAKAGAFFAKAENQIGSNNTTENSTNFLWGLGAGVKLGPVALRLEYESLDIDSENKLSQLMFSAALYFGGSDK